jgi:hypothetical protein
VAALKIYRGGQEGTEVCIREIDGRSGDAFRLEFGNDHPGPSGIDVNFDVEVEVYAEQTFAAEAAD